MMKSHGKGGAGKINDFLSMMYKDVGNHEPNQILIYFYAIYFNPKCS